MLTDLWKTSADVLAAGIRQREFSPIEVFDAVMGRVEEVNSSVNAIVTVNPRARDEARAAERAVLHGDKIGPLCGVPYTLKDLTPTAGLRTTYGSEKYRDHVPTTTAVIAKRLRGSGGVLLGKTNTPDHGCKAVTDNTIFGPTANPWDYSRTSGGSSGGAAAAVASGMAPLAEGSDFAGSIRIPASHCGVVGFKPSDGRVPVHPEPLPFFPVSFVHGPLARTVLDAAMMLDVMAGASPLDPRSIERESGDRYADIARRADPRRPGRVAYLGSMGVTRLSPQVEAPIGARLRDFEDLGFAVEELSVDMSDMMDAYSQLNSARRAALLVDDSGGLPSDLDPVLIQRVTMTQSRTAWDLARAMRAQGNAFDRIQRILENHDFIVLPVAPTPAFELGLNYPDSIAGDPLSNPLDLVGLTALFNLTGHPAVSIPAGWTDDGLPVGIQIVGPYRRDGTLIGVAAAVERMGDALPWPASEGALRAGLSTHIARNGPGRAADDQRHRDRDGLRG